MKVPLGAEFLVKIRVISIDTEYLKRPEMVLA